VASPDLATVPDTYRDLLDAKGFAHLATIEADGCPQTTPMWYLWDDEHLLFSTIKHRRKYRNLLRDRRVAVSIVDPDNPYRYVQIRGLAHIEDDPEGHIHQALVTKYIGAGITPWDEPGAERIALKVAIVRVSCSG
jgi:PPOX class probable F420-dependent enzyme